MGVWEGIKRASKTMLEEPGPGNYAATGRKIGCQHCGHRMFIEFPIVLNEFSK